MEVDQLFDDNFASYGQILCRSVMFFTFLMSALHKNYNKRDFENVIEKVIPSTLNFPGVAYVIILLIEVMILILLAINDFYIFGLALSLVVLFIFSMFIVYMIRRQIDSSCGCFGFSDRKVSWYDFARNCILIFICIMGLVLPMSNRDPISLDLLSITVLFCSLLIAVLIANIGDVLNTIAPIDG